MLNNVNFFGGGGQINRAASNPSSNNAEISFDAQVFNSATTPQGDTIEISTAATRAANNTANSKPYLIEFKPYYAQYAEPISITALNQYYNGHTNNYDAEKYRIIDTQTGESIDLKYIESIDTGKIDSPFQQNLRSGKWQIQSADSFDDNGKPQSYQDCTFEKSSLYRKTKPANTSGNNTENSTDNSTGSTNTNNAANNSTNNAASNGTTGTRVTILEFKPYYAQYAEPISITALNQYYNGRADNYDTGKYRIIDTQTGESIDLRHTDAVDDGTSKSILQINLLSGRWQLQTSNSVDEDGKPNNYTACSFEKSSLFRKTKYTENTENENDTAQNTENNENDYAAQRADALQEYMDKMNNRIIQIKDETSGNFENLNIATLNRIYNGDENNFDTLNYIITDTKTHEAISLREIAENNDNSLPDSALQQNLLDGTWEIQLLENKTGDRFTYKNANIFMNSNFAHRLYTEDDEAAKNIYEAQINLINAREKYDNI